MVMQLINIWSGNGYSAIVHYLTSSFWKPR